MQKKLTSIFILAAGCLCFFSGCGLDEYYMLDAPVRNYNTPTYETAFDGRYFSFETNETGMREYTGSDSAFKFLGTAVYYKIYNNYSTMSSNNSSISSLSSSTNYSAAATALIDRYGYKQLGTNNGTITPLIEATGTNRRIYIRLMNYQNAADYSARITVNDAPLQKSDGTNVIPMRTGNRYSFDFGRTDDNENNAVPAESDSTSLGDVNYNSTFSDTDRKIWYVDLYAVAVGRDTTYTTYYSNVLHLGAVAIDSSAKDN